MVIGVARTFVQGLSAGILGSLVGGLVLIYTLSRLGLMSFAGSRLPDLQPWLDWVHVNLGTSIPVFAILLIAYFMTLRRLAALLEREATADTPTTDRVVQLDHLTDIWTALFFGTGVIWTAIGMRGALIFALGDPEATLQGGAFAILDRMVRGGILLALSTTIFGGVGGYLMRVYKALTLGTKLQRHYDRAARIDTSRMRESLHRIERRLQGQESSSTDPRRGIGAGTTT
jgi:hypothetical protein